MALEVTVRIPVGQETPAAKALAANTPAGSRASLLAFAMQLLAELERLGDRRVLVVECPADVERQFLEGIAPGIGTAAGRRD